MAKIDIEAAKRALPLEELIRRHGVELKKAGKELKGLCPFHDEQTPSFTVTKSKQLYKCFGCDAGGDHIEFIKRYHSLNDADAIQRLAEMAGGDFNIEGITPAKTQSEREPEQPEWISGGYVPDGVLPPAELWDGGKYWPVTEVYEYRDTAGLVGFTCRIEIIKPDGTTGKNVIPMTWQVNTKSGEIKLRQGSFEKPRVLYGADLLAQNPDWNVLVVEGEKAVNAARRLFAGKPVVVVSWAGGCKAVDYADWSVLQGRKVRGWPDCDSQINKKTGEMLPYTDQPGMAAMLKIAGKIDGMSIVKVPEPGQWKDGWDLADAEEEGWDYAKVMAYIKEFTAKPSDILPKLTPVQPAQLVNDRPFRYLGWDRGRAFYLPDGCSQVTELTAAGHTKLNLLQLAPLMYWKSLYSNEEKRSSPIDWDMAADSLIRLSQSAGIFNPDMIRGRGAWFDDGRVVVHAGDRVIIDGETHKLREAPTEYIYEASKPFKLNMDDPLPDSESWRLVGLCEGLRWEHKIFGRLLAGWILSAIVCGALSWRPHIWITGGAGSGKSTVMKRIVAAVLGKLAVKYQGSTTEAAIRQKVRHDGFPVLIDEFEPDRESSKDRVDGVLALATQASSGSDNDDDSFDIGRGGAGGKAESFRVRSCFCFAGIRVGIEDQAHASRITVLSLKTPEDGATPTVEEQAEFNTMVERIIDTITPEYVSRLHARAVSLIPVIRKNAKTFGDAASLTVGANQRFGDQLGPLLAGAYALASTKEISREDAIRWIREQDCWSEMRTEQGETDATKCLSALMTYRLRVDVQAGVRSRTVAELVEKLSGDKEGDYEIQIDDAARELSRNGIRVEDGCLMVAASHDGIKRILKGSGYDTSYRDILRRCSGASITNAKRFSGLTKRAIIIPLVSISI